MLSFCLLRAADDKSAKPAAPAAADSTSTSSSSGDAFTGQLAAKGLDAKEGVAALMKISKGDKVEWVSLLATGNDAKVLDDWAVKRGSITVHGTLTPDGIKVTKVDADSAQDPVEKKKSNT